MIFVIIDFVFKCFVTVFVGSRYRYSVNIFTEQIDYQKCYNYICGEPLGQFAAAAAAAHAYLSADDCCLFVLGIRDGCNAKLLKRANTICAERLLFSATLTKSKNILIFQVGNVKKTFKKYFKYYFNTSQKYYSKYYLKDFF